MVIIAVAPLAGAWVEINLIMRRYIAVPVAPLAGAWVEMNAQATLERLYESLPLRERGLKYENLQRMGIWEVSSLPLRERGLKLSTAQFINLLVYQSLPLRERGLKSLCYEHHLGNYSVAPLAGAWVEIERRIGLSMMPTGRSPCGSVG